MTTRRVSLLALSAYALPCLVAMPARAQGRVWRIGFLSSESATSYPDRMTPVRVGLRDFGYEEGRNLVILQRWAEGKAERLPELAAELVRLQPDVIISHGTVPVLTLKQATSTIPIVAALTGDAIAVGIVESLARPGGNITGATFFNPELMVKRLDLLRNMLPRLRRAAVLLSESPLNSRVLEAMRGAADTLKIELHPFKIQDASDLKGAFAAMVRLRIDSLVVQETPGLAANYRQIAELALKHKLPAIGPGIYATAGGLLGYGADILQMYRRAGYFVDKILKGAKPADIPVEQPTTFEMVLNLKTAKALGIKVPQSILLQATKVIE